MLASCVLRALSLNMNRSCVRVGVMYAALLVFEHNEVMCTALVVFVHSAVMCTVSVVFEPHRGGCWM